jgi:hypothetical protein
MRTTKDRFYQDSMKELAYSMKVGGGTNHADLLMFLLENPKPEWTVKEIAKHPKNHIDLGGLRGAIYALNRLGAIMRIRRGTYKLDTLVIKEVCMRVEAEQE